MEDLIFKHRGWAWTRRILGGFWILFGLINLIFNESPEVKHWINSGIDFIIGVIFFTPLVGHNETRFMVINSSLKIRWRFRLREITIQEAEIEKIILRNKNIEIRRKGMKALKLFFESWKPEEKTKIYAFLIEYARQKNLVVEK